MNWRQFIGDRGYLEGQRKSRKEENVFTQGTWVSHSAEDAEDEDWLKREAEIWNVVDSCLPRAHVSKCSSRVTSSKPVSRC